MSRLSFALVGPQRFRAIARVVASLVSTIFESNGYLNDLVVGMVSI